MKNFNENCDGVDRKNTINDLSEASQQVIDKYRFTPFMEDTNKEGVAGWTISIQGKGVVAYIAEPKIKSGTSPYKIFRTKGLSFKNFFPGELKMSAYPGKENRVVSEKEIRFVPRQLLKAVAMWMDKYGTKALTEDVETTEAMAEAKAPFPKPFKKGETLFAPNKSGKMVKGELVSYETGKVVGGAFTLKLTGQNESGTIVVGAEALFKANPSKMLKKEETSADETQSLDEVQFITPKVPLKGGSNSNSKEKTDYKLYVELKDVVNDVIKKLEQAESMIRSPSKNSNLSILQTVTQAKQKLKIAVK
jgi:hypothetical protein